MKPRRVSGRLRSGAEGAGIAAAIVPGVLLLSGISLIIVIVRMFLKPFSWLQRLARANFIEPPADQQNRTNRYSRAGRHDG